MKHEIQLAALSDDPERVIRRLLSDIFGAYHGKRLQLSEELSTRAGRRISLSMINAFCSAGTETARFPASLVVPLSEITQDTRLQFFLMGPRLRSLVQLAEADLAALRDAREREQLREMLLKDLQPRGVR